MQLGVDRDDDFFGGHDIEHPAINRCLMALILGEIPQLILLCGVC